MAKRKQKLTPAEKRPRKKRQKEFMTVPIDGKQKRVRRPPMIDGMDVDEFIRRNVEPIWLHQNGPWKPVDSLGDRLNIIDSWLPSLTFAVAERCVA